jgi:hypothetical protein
MWDWWGRALPFDALIGNTDPHTENWGVLVRRQDGAPLKFESRATIRQRCSLGYERSDSALSELMAPARLTAYIKRGTHDCGWDTSEDWPTPMDLCSRYIDASLSRSMCWRSCQRVPRASPVEYQS